MDFSKVEFLISVHHLRQLPDALLPEIAFAGRSNVGKSSLINCLIGRKGLVKVSGRPGKTQGLNYFSVGEQFYLVDLPGYGYAKVPKGMKGGWDSLITNYLSNRPTLRCVVVMVDIRHEAKLMDRQLLQFLRDNSIPSLVVYTKADKLTGNSRVRNSAQLDAGLGLSCDQRILFSSKSRMGKEELIEALEHFLS